MQMKTTASLLQDNAEEKISANSFYGEYNGHKVRELEILLSSLRKSSEEEGDYGLIFTAGDSSLDNKYW